MSRWNWLDNRPQRLRTGPLSELLDDIAYCIQREQLSALKSHVKTWRGRRQEAESAVVERFGEQALVRGAAASGVRPTDASAQPYAPADRLRRPLS